MLAQGVPFYKVPHVNAEFGIGNAEVKARKLFSHRGHREHRGMKAEKKKNSTPRTQNRFFGR
jgi:hypothetical protein